VARLAKASIGAPVLAGMIGPFSLAGRLTGISEACGLTLTEPELMHLLLRKCTEFLTGYAKVFQQAGASGLIMAEPAAGLLSPKAVAEFSSAYIRQIITAVNDPGFDVILHNCGAKLIHLPATLEAGARIYHFGKAMDIVRALAKVTPDIILCGNLDPTGVFLQFNPAEIRQKTAELLLATRSHRNFAISSGCDVPPGTPLANLDAFFEAVAAEPPLV
jgi:uroporphyrinogen decarboxylase